MNFHPAAELEFLEAVTRYEAEEPGLGARFLSEVERRWQRVMRHPESARLIDRKDLRQPVRAAVVRTFPYLIIYVSEPQVVVIAVAHTRRRPSYWADRV